MRSNGRGKRLVVTVRCPPALVPAVGDPSPSGDDGFWPDEPWRDAVWEARAATWPHLIHEADVLEPRAVHEDSVDAALDEMAPTVAVDSPADVRSVDEVLAAVAAAGAGAQAIALLVSLKGRELTDDQRLSVVQLWQPQLSWVTGAEQAAVLAFAGAAPDPGDAVAVLNDSFTAYELGPAVGCSPKQAQHKIDYARVLHHRFPATAAQLQAGRLDPYRVWLLVDRLSTLPQAAAAVVEAELLPHAAGWATGTLAGKLRDACRAADPDWSLRRYAQARKTRRVSFDPDAEEGLVRLVAALPPVEALAMQQHLETAANQPAPRPDDPRCHDERMADALIAAVLGSTPGDPTTPLTPQVTVQVLVSLPTLLGLRQDPGELRGYGPIPPDLARDLAADAFWQRWVYDEVDGHLLDLGSHRYRPSAELEAYLRARDRIDRFPGGTLTAQRCDLDHTQPFNHIYTPTCHPTTDNPPDGAGPDDRPPGPHGPAGTDNASPPVDDPCPHPGGATASRNLVSLSRRAHRAKTLGGYRTTQGPDGTLNVTTPLGRTYTTKPWDYRPASDRRG